MYTVHFKLLCYLDWLMNLSLAEHKLDFEIIKQLQNNIKCENVEQLNCIINLEVINVIELLFFNCHFDSLKLKKGVFNSFKEFEKDVVW